MSISCVWWCVPYITIKMAFSLAMNMFLYTWEALLDPKVVGGAVDT